MSRAETIARCLVAASDERGSFYHTLDLGTAQVQVAYNLLARGREWAYKDGRGRWHNGKSWEQITRYLGRVMREAGEPDLF
jgi:hypothetical protein